MALTAESRSAFVSSAVDMVLEYGFDGLDVDWEYPGKQGRPQPMLASLGARSRSLSLSHR